MKKLFLICAFVIALSGFIICGETKNVSESSWAVKNSRSKIANEFSGYDCSNGWRITGYFTPIEADYGSGETREIEIKNVGKMKFNVDFLRTVFDENAGFGEGWGRTRFGWYLGNYDGAWHKADAPLDANNAPLLTNSVAVDNAVIPNDSIIKIPALPGAFGKENFVANDVGVTVRGKHIDVYTGEGKEAEKLMYRVTFEDENLTEVCFKKP